MHTNAHKSHTHALTVHTQHAKVRTTCARTHAHTRTHIHTQTNTNTYMHTLTHTNTLTCVETQTGSHTDHLELAFCGECTQEAIAAKIMWHAITANKTVTLTMVEQIGAQCTSARAAQPQHHRPNIRSVCQLA